MLKKGSKGTEVSAVQRILNITADGIFGAITEEAVKEYQRKKGLVPDGIVGANTLRKMGLMNQPAEIDNLSQERISKLHPSVRDQVTQIVRECNVALNGRAKVRITQGLRSMKEQSDLYAKGRSMPGPKVTNAKPGQSVHNYGFAVDIVLIIDGKTVSYDTKKDYDSDQVGDWDECVKIFAAHGWAWGGNWTSFKDMPHFEKIGYNNPSKLNRMKKDPEGYVVL